MFFTEPLIRKKEEEDVFDEGIRGMEKMVKSQKWFILINSKLSPKKTKQNIQNETFKFVVCIAV